MRPVAMSFNKPRTRKYIQMPRKSSRVKQKRIINMFKNQADLVLRRAQFK